MNGFSALMVIALVNGLIHCQVFFVLYGAVGLTQGSSNLAAFGVAAAFSFYVNALYIFEPGESWRSYLLCNGLMGILSYAVGSMGDGLGSPGWVTVALYCLLNLAMGYSLFRFKPLRASQQP
ncbi:MULTISPECIES: GtrA family protein [Pseudomonas]|uniref:GtrA family protein n=1 Tax=Pseudomonas TaxID=286 RepID=UPI0020A12AA2|nr:MULTISPECIES: polysaccharide synthesis protein GtrA [Pseudomonas]MCP1457722.1 putative flippase GtrA [Pseudomonas kilonensis]UVM60315.1 polysaccharide synthesis protein GtrA [Pseudomonas sp. B21-010]